MTCTNSFQHFCTQAIAQDPLVSEPRLIGGKSLMEMIELGKRVISYTYMGPYIYKRSF